MNLQPAIEGDHAGCLLCSPTKSQMCPKALIAVGFGSATLTRDGETIYQEDDASLMTCEQAEELAAADPDHDWRINLHGPLRGAVYQRHGPVAWMLIETDRGFA